MTREKAKLFNKQNVFKKIYISYFRQPVPMHNIEKLYFCLLFSVHCLHFTAIWMHLAWGGESGHFSKIFN